MNLKEIHSAVQELCEISERPRSKIDFADINEQFRRIEMAGLPINKSQELRGYRDRAYDRFSELQRMRSDAPERAEFIAKSAGFFLAIHSEAYRLANPES